MTRGTRIALVVAGFMVAGSVPTIIGYVRAYRDRGKVSPGMSLTSVFGAVEGWNLCINSYLDESTAEFGTFSIAKDPGAPTYRAAKDDKTMYSKEEFVQFIGQQMNNGKSWNSQFTYFAGPVRNTFRVDFDANGRVVNVSGMGGGP
jgi:hypothetical protein